MRVQMPLEAQPVRVSKVDIKPKSHEAQGVLVATANRQPHGTRAADAPRMPLQHTPMHLGPRCT